MTSSFHFPLVREMQPWVESPVHDKDVFHFPLVREMQQLYCGLRVGDAFFHFPLVREMQHMQTSQQYYVLAFHFPLVREMQLYGKKATKHAEGQSFLREPRFSRPASRNFSWASSMFGAGSRKQEQQKSRAFSRFPISPEQYDKHQEYTERKHHDTSFRE